jgi:hypothetical protein
LIARPLAALSLLLLALGAAPAARAQESATRFEITEVGDTTFTFRLADRSGWVRSGLAGIAVDPRRRDLLIARFRVVGVREGLATALITGQTTLVETEHVALLTRPRTPWYRQRAFWVGLLLGGGIGAGAASL